MADGTAVFLPPEISFLAFHGVNLATLWEAGRIARQSGVTADRALLATGLVREDHFYRALALEMRLPFFAADEIAVHPQARFPDCLFEGALPLARTEKGPNLAVAPTGPALLRLLGSRNRNISGLAIMSPSGLRGAITGQRATTIAADASEALTRVDRDLCFRGGLSARQMIALGLTFGLAAVGWALFGAAALLVISLLISIPFFTLTALRIKAAVTPIGIDPEQRPPRAGDDKLPVYTVLVPLHHETRVLDRLTNALKALDYPAGRLDIKLILEEDDLETLTALAQIELPGCFEVIRAPPGQPRTKPRALNIALPLARGEFVTIYDAEDVPDPGQLRLAVAIFGSAEREIACLQGRLVIDNTDDGLLQKLFTIEYAALFDVLNPVLAATGGPVPLGGTSNHFRTAVLREIGAWDAWNVTEDADLGLRLALRGYRVADLPSSTCEEAPPGLRAWLHQRKRWLKGFAQVCITHTRHPQRACYALGWRMSLRALAVTLGTLLSALGYPFFLAACVYALVDGRILHPATVLEGASTLLGLTLFVAGFFAMLLPPWVAVRRRGWPSLLPYVALMPLYYALVSLAAWLGMAELLRKPSHWNKTEHGFARTSRRAGARREDWLEPVADGGLAVGKATRATSVEPTDYR